MLKLCRAIFAAASTLKVGIPEQIFSLTGYTGLSLELCPTGSGGPQPRLSTQPVWERPVAPPENPTKPMVHPVRSIATVTIRYSL